MQHTLTGNKRHHAKTCGLSTSSKAHRRQELAVKALKKARISPSRCATGTNRIYFNHRRTARTPCHAARGCAPCRLCIFGNWQKWHKSDSAPTQYACHELHLFLYRHDREFFSGGGTHVRNKLFYTIDDRLDPRSYRQPAAWAASIILNGLLAQRLGKMGRIRTNCPST